MPDREWTDAWISTTFKEAKERQDRFETRTVARLEDVENKVDKVVDRQLTILVGLIATLGGMLATVGYTIAQIAGGS